MQDTAPIQPEEAGKEHVSPEETASIKQAGFSFSDYLTVSLMMAFIFLVLDGIYRNDMLFTIVDKVQLVVNIAVMVIFYSLGAFFFAGILFYFRRDGIQ